MKTLLLVLVLLLRLASAALAQSTHLTGTVRDAGGQPLPGVNVFLKTTFDGVSTDPEGHFEFTTAQTGALPLVVALIGYEPQELPLTLGQGAIILPAIKLKPTRAQLGDVVVTAGAFEAGDEKRGTVLSSLDIVTTAGSVGDITGALNALPGTTRVGEEGKLFVRGGAASETKTYLDGLPVQNSYGGSVPAVPARGRFSPFLFKGTVFSTGGYSAEYGQALSAVVGLNSDDLAAETQTGISLMSLGGSLSRTRRWERTSLALTADYTNLAPYVALAVPGQGWDQAPQTRGGSLSLRHRTGQAGMLKVYGTVSHQQMAIRQPDANPEYAQTGRPVALLNDNAYLNTSFRSPLRHGWSLNTGLALTHDDNLTRPDQQRLRDLEQSAVARLVLTNDSAATWFNLKLGTEAYAQHYRQQYQPTPEAETRHLGFDEQRAAAFAESDLVPARRLAARAGLRAEYSALLHDYSLAPRLALAYQTGTASQLSAAWGRFYQTPTNDLLRFSTNLKFEQSEHLLLTYQRIANNRTLRAEIYRKTYRDLVTFDPQNIYSPATYRNAGRGYAQGLDLFWRDKTTFKKVDYWVSYGLLDTRRQYRADPVEAVPTFAAAHNLSVVAKYWAPKLHTQFSATYSYGSPRRYNDPTTPHYNQGRTPAFHDLSLNASYLTTLFGQFTIIHVSASNVLGRRNIFGYRYADAPDAGGQLNRVAVTAPVPQMLFVGVFISINKKAKVDLETAPD